MYASEGLGPAKDRQAGLPRGSASRKGIQMKRSISGALLIGLLATIVALSAQPAHADAPACEPGTPGFNGCKSDTTTETTKETGDGSGGFNVTQTETQRGNPNAGGTENTEQSSDPVCTGPSGNELRPDHPQCQPS